MNESETLGFHTSACIASVFVGLAVCIANLSCHCHSSRLKSKEQSIA